MKFELFNKNKKQIHIQKVYLKKRIELIKLDANRNRNRNRRRRRNLKTIKDILSAYLVVLNLKLILT